MGKTVKRKTKAAKRPSWRTLLRQAQQAEEQGHPITAGRMRRAAKEARRLAQQAKADPMLAEFAEIALTADPKSESPSWKVERNADGMLEASRTGEPVVNADADVIEQTMVALFGNDAWAAKSDEQKHAARTHARRLQAHASWETQHRLRREYIVRHRRQLACSFLAVFEQAASAETVVMARVTLQAIAESLREAGYTPTGYYRETASNADMQERT